MNAFLKKKEGGANKYLYLKRCHIYVSTDTTDDAVVYRDLIRWCPICPETPLLCQLKKNTIFYNKSNALYVYGILFVDRFKGNQY